jgi:uncharacterized membrane protein
MKDVYFVLMLCALAFILGALFIYNASTRIDNQLISLFFGLCGLCVTILVVVWTREDKKLGEH